MNFYFLCLVCNKKGNEKKICFFFLFFYILLCPYKCEGCIKIMGKYVTSYHIMLFMWVIIFLKPLSPFKFAQIGWIANMWPREAVSALLLSSMLTKWRKRLYFLSFLFSSSLFQRFQTHC